MRRLLFLLSALCATMLFTGAARAQNAPGCELMIDSSGSMAGYYRAEAVNYAPETARSRLRPLLETLRRTCARSYLFDLRLHALAGGAPIVAGSGDTNIGESLGEWSRNAADGSFLILVTDNVEDTGAGRASGNERFYDLLRRRDSAFSHVSVLALRAPFSGPLFGPDAAPGVQYAGPRALTIYILAKRAEGRDADYQAVRSSVERLLAQSGRREFEGVRDDDYGSYVLFDVRPFATETFRVQARSVVLRGSRSGGSHCARTRFDPRSGTFFLLDQQMGVPCDVSALLRVAIPQRWCLNDTSLAATASITAGDPTLREKLSAEVTPPRANLCSEEQELRTTLRFNPIEYDADVSFGERLRRAFWNTFEADGELRIVGALARNNVNLGSAVDQAWSFDTPAGIASPDPAMQRRVFQLDSAVRSVVPEQVLSANELVRFRVEVRGRYRQGPLLAILAVGLLLLLLVAVAVFLARKPRVIAIESSDGSESQLRLALFGSGTARSATGDIQVVVRNLGLCFFVRSNARIARGRFLSRSGGRVEIGSAGSGRSRSGGRGGAAADDWDSFDVGPGAAATADEPRLVFMIRAIAGDGRRREEVYDDGF